jgi:hypothetical protein
MGRRLMRIVAAIFFFVMGVTPFAWGEVTQVTIIYSNNINGQIDPVG